MARTLLLFRCKVLALCLLLSACGGGDEAPTGNVAPVAADDAFTIPAMQPALLDVLANDRDGNGDALTISITRAPPGAQARVMDGRIELSPGPGVTGPTDLGYRVTDLGGASDDATARIVVGSATPLFYLSVDTNGAQQVLRHDFLTTTTIPTPLPAGETLDAFLPSADGRRLVYFSRQQGSPVRHRIWVRELTDLRQPVREIATPPNFQADTSMLALSADGRHGAFDGLFVSLDAPGRMWDVPSRMADAQFTRDGTRVFFVAPVDNGVARVVMRGTVTTSGLPLTQITSAPASGTGVTGKVSLSPDETLVLTQRFLGAAGGGLEQRVFITPTNGSRADRALTNPQSAANEVTSGFAPDGQLAWLSYRVAAGNGIKSIPVPIAGFASVAIAAPPGLYAEGVQVAADSRTYFYYVFGQEAVSDPWYRARFDQPGESARYAPSGVTAPQTLDLAPDGRSLFFRAGSAWYVAAGPDFDLPRALHTGDATPTTEVVGYSPDSHVLALNVREADRRILLLNPAIPGWSRQLSYSTSTNPICVIWAGSRCGTPILAAPSYTAGAPTER